VRGLGHERARDVVVPEGDEQRFGPRDGAEERQHQVGEDVAVAVERRDHHRGSARGDQERERRVDELWLVRHVGMTRSRGVHLLLEHALVDRAHRVLGPAEDLRAHPLGLAERELGNGVTDSPLDPLRAKRSLVVAFALAPLRRAVRVADRHANHRDRGMHAAERNHAGNAPAGADDDLPAYLLAKDPVRRPDVACDFRGDRRRLQAESVLANRCGCLVDDAVRGRAPILEGEVEAGEVELDSDHL